MPISDLSPATAHGARAARRCACSYPNFFGGAHVIPGSISNRLLAALAPADLVSLRTHLELVPLPQKEVLSSSGAPIDHVYFLQQGMVSLVQPLENGAMIEVGMIGREGFVGVPILLGTDTSPLEAMVQIPGSALRMPAGQFRQEVGRRIALAQLLLRYTQALHV